MDGTLVSLYEGDGSGAGARMESRNGKAQRLVFLAFGLCCELFLLALTLVFTLWYPTFYSWGLLTNLVHRKGISSAFYD